jgi:hypothetical protein
MFFNKQINLTAYTSDPSYYASCKPVYKSNVKPDWITRVGAYIKTWDDRSGLYNKAGTVATCPGIKDFLSKPIQIPMWGDIDIRINPDGTWTSNGRPDYDLHIGQHYPAQYGDAYKDRVALKLSSPWQFVSESKINYLFTESHYSTSYFRELGILFPPGVINFKYQHSTNIHFNCPIRSEPYVISLKHGMPLVSIFPMTERSINFEVKKIGRDEFNEINQHMPKMVVGRYFKQEGYKND